MKSIYLFLPAILALSQSPDAFAQLKESVDVEGRYEKEILHPDKLGRLPERLRLSPPQSDLDYAFKGVPADFIPSGIAIPATSYGAERLGPAPRGYLNLSMGSWLNSDLKAGYTAIDSPDRTFNIWLRHASTSLWKPFHDLNSADDRCRFNYQETLGADWSSAIGRSLRLDAGLRYHFGYFNYYGVQTPEELLSGDAPSEFPKFPTQTLNDLAVSISLTDMSPDFSRNSWNASVDVRHFAFRTATRETSLRLGGGYRRVLSSDPADLSRPTSEIGIDGDFRWLLYAGHADTYTPDGYGNLRLSPGYRWSNSGLSLRLGFNADLTFNADAANPVDPTSHYSLFHISPDVRFDYAGSHFAAWIHATGGQELQTLASIADRNLYAWPELQSTTPLYVPIDAQIGFRLKPFGGVSIEAHAGYKISNNVRGDGWTIPLLDAQLGNSSLLPSGVSNGVATCGLGRARYDLKGIYAGAAISYRYSDILDIRADMQYAPQSGEHGVYNGCDRPRWILRPALTLHPVKALTIGVDYEYRGVRNVWSAVMADNTSAIASGSGTGIGTGAGPSIDPDNGSGSGIGSSGNTTDASMKPVGIRLPDITRLNARAAYTFTRLGSLHSLTLGVDARNLLNQREILLPGLPSEGLTISGSIGIIF
ncbi:MAG: hypothetical protein HDT05_05305 [Bacteroidales bacterium]|nr:hypothetical protein [Bacteroidales bacterium]